MSGCLGAVLERHKALVKRGHAQNEEAGGFPLSRLKHLVESLNVIKLQHFKELDGILDISAWSEISLCNKMDEWMMRSYEHI